MFAKVFTLLPLLALVASAPVETETAQLEKRIDHSGTATYYETGLGACGWWNNNNDKIVALNAPQYWANNGGNCGQWMKITNNQNGKTAEAFVADLCPSCGDGDLDMSPSLFAELNNGNMDAGVFDITWNFHPK